MIATMTDQETGTDSERRGGIMVVDDQPANLKLLEVMLQRHGYEVRSFPRGRLALAAAAQNPPDLILLDINMPEMNGYQVCEQLKSRQELSRIPVIFLSALSETEDKVKALRCGGVDYITKPFQVDEVQARVETHLELHRLQRALQAHTENLEEVVRSRTRELSEAHARLMILDRSKSDFLNLISHEFRSPLNGLLGVGELLLDEASPDSDGAKLRHMFEESSRRILTILEDALLLTQIEVEAEKFSPEPVPLGSVLVAAIGRAGAFAGSRQVTIEPAPAVVVSVLGEEDLLVKALHSLLETAVKFSSAGGVVRLSCQLVPDAILVRIESGGSRIPAGALGKFFDLFSIGEAITPGGDLGLGPPVAYRILSLFGGGVTAENREPSGIRLTASFRRAHPRSGLG
jgi:two-component system sensor histidine kinase/response regulator